MNDFQIRYCTAADGTNIAYGMIGEGPLLLHAPPGPIGHLAGEMRVGDIRRWYERLARSFTVVRYDPRGAGSSDRMAVQDFHMAHQMDIEAVAVALQSPVIAYAWTSWVLPLLELAGRRPELFSHLILWDPIARVKDYRPSPRLRALRTLIEHDWRAYTDAWAQSGWGWGRAESGREWASWHREGSTPDYTLSRIDWFEQSSDDVSEWLPRITAQTLVVGHEAQTFADPAAAKRVAARIPNARLTILDGVQYSPPMLPDQVDGNARLIEEFVGIRSAPQASPVAMASARRDGTAVILFTDIADSTAITERMGDAAFRAAARALDDRMRAAMRECAGTPVEGKVLGDGVMAVFASAAQAIDAARRCVALSAESELRLHVGLHAGDVIREDNNVYGGAVNIAARICGLSAPGEILVSATIRDLARTSAGAAFEDRGEHALKGIDDPVRLFAVR